MDTLHRFWTDPNLDKDEVFLRDYILNRGWVDTTECVPTYQEILEEQPDVSDVSLITSVVLFAIHLCSQHTLYLYCCRMRKLSRNKMSLRDNTTSDLKSLIKKRF